MRCCATSLLYPVWRRTLAVALVLILVALATCLLGLRSLCAEQAAPPAGDRTQYVENRFKQMDKNGDGKLDPQEMTNADLFKKVDTNADGFVSLEEAKAYFAGQGGGGQPAGTPAGGNQGGGVEQQFKQRDKNGDGVLSADEVGDAAMFRRLDANGDGGVTLDEAKAYFAAQGNQAGGAPVPVGPEVSFKPLTDLGPELYQGYPGGLYPGGANVPPPEYLQQGLAAAQAVQPLNHAGQPDPNGAIVLLSIGMSNATQEFSTFKRLADADPAKNPRLVIVDGAQGGQTSTVIKNPAAQFWANVDQRLAAAGVNAQQVQVVWLKEAIAGPTKAFPADAQELRDDLRLVLQVMQARYPNLKLVYVSSRIYAGYATTRLNPEPYAYQSGFAVKWLIEERIQQGAPGPWVAWGPYLWTDGMRGRADGLVWNREDCGPDGTHPAPSGQRKVAELLLQFFKTDETAKVWFLE